jgi:hypothetical protein
MTISLRATQAVAAFLDENMQPRMVFRVKRIMFRPISVADHPCYASPHWSDQSETFPGIGQLPCPVRSFAWDQ